MNLFSVLINPQREELELGERALVCSAANVLQVGEFQLLQLAYRSWFGEDLPEALTDRLFTSYMLRNEVPHWARHFARTILARDAHGGLDPNSPAWHRYDHAFARRQPLRSARAFMTATGVVALTLVSAIVAASMMATEPTSILPPFFERAHLPSETGHPPLAAEPSR